MASGIIYGRQRCAADTSVFFLTILDLGKTMRQGRQHAHLPQMPHATGIHADPHELISIHSAGLSIDFK